MKTPWYRNLFAAAPTFDLHRTRIKADDGDADAQFALGLSYGSEGESVPDLLQAIQWYRRAAEQDHALAQFNLGVMYAQGQGVPRDDVEGVRWIRRAAALGDAGAQFNLGTRFYRASVDGSQMDVVESRIEAYKWLHLAAAQGYRDAAASCERVALSMAREEVIEGNHRAAAFVTDHPPKTRRQ